MNNDNKDPNLGTPQEANTTKHINFREVEETDSTNTSEDKKSDDDNPTKKAWEEMRKENQTKE